MKISGLFVKNFRSIDQLKINRLGNINVFVGKNNSGKSTVLKSIDSFLKIMDKKMVVRTYEKKDFYRNRTQLPIKIACSITVGDSKFDELLKIMKEEYPQLVSGVEALENYKTINVYTSSINYSENNQVFSYIEKISLSEECPFTDEELPEKIILNTNEEVIKELISRQLKIDDLTKKVGQLEDGLDAIGAEDYSRYKERRMVGYKVKGNDTLIDLINSTSDFHEFRNRLREEIDNYNQEIYRLTTQETINELQVFSGRTKSVPNHIYWLIGFFESTRILQEAERKSPIEKKDAERLLDLKVTRGGTERLAQLQNTVSELLGVRVDAFKGEDKLANAEIDIDNFLVDMNGAGIRESLRLILDFEFTKPQIVLIEEPEVHLHFELERKLFRYLVSLSNEAQIFMTTHSTGFIDSSESNNIFLVKKEMDTTVTTISNNGLLEVISELGINISSLLLSKVIVFVEGPTDEEVIRLYLEKFHSNYPHIGIRNIRMTGIGNYKYYANAHALEVFNNYGLKTLFILDADSRSEDEIKRLKENHPKTSAIKVLPKRCIENYFLEPSIILRFIQKKMTNAGLIQNVPTDADLPRIEERMMEVVELLFPETIRLHLTWKFLKPIYPLSHFGKAVKLNSIDSVIEWIKCGAKEAEDSINLSYADLEKVIPPEIEIIKQIWEARKLEVVPGDKVIDIVCSDYGIRYNKTKMDIGLLCQILNNGEWPANLSEILNEVTTLARR